MPADGDISHRIGTIETHEPELTEDELLRKNNGRVCDELQARGLDDGDDLAPSSSMVPNTELSSTEEELIEAHLQERRDRLTVSAPHIRRTPLDELGRTHLLFALAFPTLFPKARADWHQVRAREVTLAQWSQHMLKFHDMRFGTHPYFRYLAYNMEMRQRSEAASAFYISRNPTVRDFTEEELSEALAAGDGLLKSMARAGAAIPGTRPFWQQKRNHLMAQVRGLGTTGALFCTWSCADHQWDDLHRHLPRYREWKDGTDQERKNIASYNVQNYPHVIAAWLDIRFKCFLDVVAKAFYGITDSWYRYEWQARGTGHIHCILWMNEAPKMGPVTV